MDSLRLSLTRSHPRGLTLVEQLVEGITAAVDDLRLKPGTPMPSVRNLAQRLGISTFTAAESYARLVAQNYLTAKRGSGYVVAARLSLRGKSAAPIWQPPTLNASWLLSEVFADHSIPIKAGAGWLPSDWLNETGLRLAVRGASRVPTGQLSGYGHPFGYRPLRDQIATRLASHGLPCDAAQIVLTHGATHAIDVAVRTLLKPGDTVVVEDPCYCNLLQILRLAGLNAVGVARTSEGVDTESLERVLSTGGAKAVFVNTALQNPTGTSLPTASAYRVLQLAERYGAWIIEDDIYRELAPPGTAMLAAMDGLNRVIYVGGFSKTVTPSMRVGYVAAAPQVVSELARVKMAVGLTSSEVAERLVHSILVGGHFDGHLAQLVGRLRAQHRAVGELMDASGIERAHSPEGGLFVWGRATGDLVDCDARDIAAAALADGIWLAPGSYFRVMDKPSPWFRFNVATSTDPRLWAFFRKLKRADLSKRQS